MSRGAYKAHYLAPSLYTSRLCYFGCEVVSEYSYAEKSVYVFRGADQLKNMDKAKPTEQLLSMNPESEAQYPKVKMD